VTVNLQSNPKDRGDLAGCGRHEDLSLALSRAYAETIERVVALEAQNEMDFTATHELFLDEKTISVSGAPCPAPMPPSAIRTTNGWAVHFSIEGAIQVALREAIERHLLLLSFLKCGWLGFCRGETISWDGLQVHSLGTRFSLGGFRAGMVAAKLHSHPGYTFGYFCDDETSFQSSRRWIHALLEAYEPAKFFEQQSPRQVQESLASAKDPLDRTQLYYVLSNDTEIQGVRKGEDVCSPWDSKTRFVAKVAVVDIGKKMNLGFGFFGAFVFGGSLIPLYFKDTLDPGSVAYLERQLAPYQIGVLPNVHPIL